MLISSYNQLKGRLQLAKEKRGAQPKVKTSYT